MWTMCNNDAFTPAVTGTGPKMYSWCDWDDMSVAASEVIAVDVELYGKPCMDPVKHPKATWKAYPLINEDGDTGCTKRLGVDTMAVQIDK